MKLVISINFATSCLLAHLVKMLKTRKNLKGKFAGRRENQDVGAATLVPGNRLKPEQD